MSTGYRGEQDDGREQSAGRSAAFLTGWVSLATAGTLGAFSIFRDMTSDSRWSAVLASACLNVAMVAFWRSRAARRSRDVEAAPVWKCLVSFAKLFLSRDTDPPEFDPLVFLRGVDWQPWLIAACPCLSVAFAATALRPLPPDALVRAMADPSMTIVAVAVALILAFVTLVAERFYQDAAGRVQLDIHGEHAASLAGMLRVLLLCALGASLSAGWLIYAHTALDLPVQFAAVLCAAIAVEMLARLLVQWIFPPRARQPAQPVPSSLLAALLRYRRSPLASLGDELHARYGIDLRQNWVLRSVARMLPATLAAMALCAWLLTSVRVLDPSQRAVYERFGAPVAVWSPGLHVGMPWPFGNARLVDNGVVHQLIVSGGADDSSVAAPIGDADGATPEQLNRLWDVQHPWETSQVIAGASGDQQSFQIVNADVRLDYRIGLSDAAARAALYRAVDPESTVRSIANREVMHYLASHTLEALLQTSQTAIAEQVRGAVQRQLDQLDSGIEVVAVVIESVHPPTGAASAYHDVQAAQIRAQASVAKARGFAAQLLGNAQQEAQNGVAQASAQAADTLSAARVQQTNFAADTIAYRLGGPAFAFEYYLARLQHGLQNVRITVIDDRLVEDRRATLDLRTFTSGDLAGIPRGN